MYIRRVITRRTASGETYHSYRLVESRREGGRVRQVALLNLGRHFDLPEALWPVLCARLGQLLGNQGDMVSVDLPDAVETHAQTLAARFVARAPTEAGGAEYVEVDVASMELVQPRSVGVEQLGLYALAQLELDPLLATLGVNAVTRAMILAQVVGRMAAPASELATWGWLNEVSALPELLDLSLTDMSIMRLYRAADVLMKHQAVIEEHLFGRVRDLFGLEATVNLYDLTNTYFEGGAAAIPMAKRGHSKEKRTDCPLLTLGLVLDASGFVRRSRMLAACLANKAVECRTLEGMLKDLDVPAGALIVMDRGIATEANLEWLRAQGYRYLVVSRELTRVMPQSEMTVTTAGGDAVRVEKVLDEAAGEVRLYCHSPRRELKEAGINQRFCDRFEAGLQKLADGLSSARGAKRPEQTQVTRLSWEKTPVEGTMLTDPGVYCLRSNETGWSEEQLWRTYMMLTDLEVVFRSLKSELGLRSVYHLKAERADGHLFISVLAYQCVQLIRRQLKAKGMDQRWSGLRETLSVQRRVTARFAQKDGRTLNVRKATQPEPKLKAIYEALGLNPLPGGTKKMVA